MALWRFWVFLSFASAYLMAYQICEAQQVPAFLNRTHDLLLSKTLTSVEAKPIAATMARTASTAKYELGLLSAAGTLTIIPRAFVIYFVRNYIAKGFALGRV